MFGCLRRPFIGADAPRGSTLPMSLVEQFGLLVEGRECCPIACLAAWLPGRMELCRQHAQKSRPCGLRAFGPQSNLWPIATVGGLIAMSLCFLIVVALFMHQADQCQQSHQSTHLSTVLSALVSVSWAHRLVDPVGTYLCFLGV